MICTCVIHICCVLFAFWLCGNWRKSTKIDSAEIGITRHINHVIGWILAATYHFLIQLYNMMLWCNRHSKSTNWTWSLFPFSTIPAFFILSLAFRICCQIICKQVCLLITILFEKHEISLSDWVTRHDTMEMMTKRKYIILLRRKREKIGYLFLLFWVFWQQKWQQQQQRRWRWWVQSVCIWLHTTTHSPKNGWRRDEGKLYNKQHHIFVLITL